MIRIAAAQLNSTVGNLELNLKKHYQYIQQAILNNVSLITFPEMSITGYTRKQGNELALTCDSPELNQLKKLSTEGNLIIVAGAPIKLNKTLFIGSFIIYPNKPVDTYIKRFLHTGEDLYYQSSLDYNPIIKINQERISLAICAEINHKEHIKTAHCNNSTIYLPSIFYSENGMEEAHSILSNYAKEFNIPILMSNYCGKTWNIVAGGKSAFWDNNGSKIDALTLEHEGLLIIEKEKNSWQTFSEKTQE
ncbi:carbon-nitrogen hydrolase family protein [Wenyingzhuangia sp. IMCC45574]